MLSSCPHRWMLGLPGCSLFRYLWLSVVILLLNGSDHGCFPHPHINSGGGVAIRHQQHHQQHHQQPPPPQQQHLNASGPPPAPAPVDLSADLVDLAGVVLGRGSDGAFLTTFADDSSNSNNSVVRAHAGATVVLPCAVRDGASFGVISWARQLPLAHSYQILTIAEATYIDDERFAVHSAAAAQNDWSLKVTRVATGDSGMYRCQANSHPPQFITIELDVQEASAEISGPEDRFIKAGSTLELKCNFHRLTEPPKFVFWYHDRKMINHDWSWRGLWLSAATAASATLTLPAAAPADSGNYTCAPEHARPSSVMVHVIREGGDGSGRPGAAAAAAAAVHEGKEQDETASASAAAAAAIGPFCTPSTWFFMAVAALSPRRLPLTGG